MKILFYRYNSICEPDMIEAFQSFGLTVIEEKTEMTDKSLSSKDRIALLQKHFLESGDEPFLFVFSFNFFPAISDLCQIYNITYVCWSVDSPLAEIYSKSICNSCNRLFLFDKQQYESLKSHNPDCIFHLPLCTNTKRWDSVVCSIGDEDFLKYKSDISFVGSLYTEKDPWLTIEKNNSLSSHTLGFAEALSVAQAKLVGCNTLEDALSDPIADEIVNAYPKQLADDAYCVQPMNRYVAAQHILGMHASSLFRINALAELAKCFSVDLYTRSPLPEMPDGIHLHNGAETLTEMPKIFHLSKINLNKC